jgi:hypothetical protein
MISCSFSTSALAVSRSARNVSRSTRNRSTAPFCASSIDIKAVSRACSWTGFCRGSEASTSMP